MPNVSSPLEMTDEQIGRLYETIGAANDLLGKGVAPSLSCHTDVVRAAITLMHLYDAVRGERAGDERREPNPDSTADETLVLECVRRYGNNPVGEAAMRICCDRVRARLAQYRAALATLTRERAAERKTYDDLAAEYDKLTEAYTRTADALKTLHTVIDTDESLTEAGDPQAYIDIARDGAHALDTYPKVIEDQQRSIDRVTRELSEARKDSARLQWLDARVRSHTPWRDTVIMFDHEDGMWLAEAERGEIRATPLDHWSDACRDIREAIDAAIRKHTALQTTEVPRA